MLNFWKRDAQTADPKAKFHFDVKSSILHHHEGCVPARRLRQRVPGSGQMDHPAIHAADHGCRLCRHHTQTHTLLET